MEALEPQRSGAWDPFVLILLLFFPSCHLQNKAKM